MTIIIDVRVDKLQCSCSMLLWCYFDAVMIFWSFLAIRWGNQLSRQAYVCQWHQPCHDFYLARGNYAGWLVDAVLCFFLFALWNVFMCHHQQSRTCVCVCAWTVQTYSYERERERKREKERGRAGRCCWLGYYHSTDATTLYTTCACLSYARWDEMRELL
jgi:hypothetical protein